MPAKKKKKGGKKKSTAKAAPASDVSFEPLILPQTIEEWVTLNVKLVNWDHMNFATRVKTTTPLFSIRRMLKERHGRMDELTLYKEQASPATQLDDEMATLEEVGASGAPKDAPPVEFTLLYDFKPHEHDDPLLLAT